jgi:hypothetical protein
LNKIPLDEGEHRLKMRGLPGGFEENPDPDVIEVAKQRFNYDPELEAQKLKQLDKMRDVMAAEDLMEESTKMSQLT